MKTYFGDPNAKLAIARHAHGGGMFAVRGSENPDKTHRRKPKLQDGEDEEVGAPAPPRPHGAPPPRALYQPPPGGAQPHP